jgi:hypothetical protein
MTIFRSNHYDIEFLDDGHKYKVTVDGVVTYPISVTKKLKRHGIGIYHTAEQTGDNYMVRGTDIHDYCTAYAESTLKWSVVWCDYIPYVESFKKWFDNNVAETIACEVPLYEINLKYCGKFDLLVRLNNGRVALVEIKTGAMPQWVGLQLVGYGKIVNNHIKIDDYIALELQPDGLKAKVWIMSHDSEDFAVNYSVWGSLFDGTFIYDKWKGNRKRRRMESLK